MFELNDFTLEVCSLPVIPPILTYKNVHVFNGILLCYYLFNHESEYFRDLTYSYIMLIIYNNCYNFTKCFVASFSLLANSTHKKMSSLFN